MTDNLIDSGPLAEVLAAAATADTDLISSLLTRYGLRLNEDSGAIEPDDFELDDEEFTDNMTRLLNETLWYASCAMMIAATNYNGDFLTRHLDDQGDYSNAISDQIRECLNILNGDDGTSTTRSTLELLNMSSAQVDDWNGASARFAYPACFLYGYADHFTPFSALCLMNNKED